MHSDTSKGTPQPIAYWQRRLAQLLCLLCVAAYLSSCDHPSTDSATETTMHAPIIETEQGRAEGYWAKSQQTIRAFKGLPFARPPVGHLRWRPPEPAQPWAGVRDATQPGAACWQAYSDDAFVWTRGEFPRSEDCLYLNVWTQDTAEPKRPVMVWFHGGAHTGGFGHVDLFDGTALAELGVVVVTINYRLGPWGFLAHPALAAESEHNAAGNYGLMDKLAALHWVQSNIAKFGGDPENVTIFGQSAGSSSVCALLTSPLSSGLFHKVIGQSAACFNNFSYDANGQERGRELINRLLPETESPTADDLRRLDNQDILGAVGASGWALSSRIVVDGYVLPEPPVQTFREGRQLHLPTVLGSTANEGFMLFPVNNALSANAFDDWLAQRYPGRSDALKAAYAEALTRSPGAAQHAIFTDEFMALSMRSWAGFNDAAEMPTYLYFMTHVPPAYPIYLDDQPEISLPGGPRSAGAYHSGDLAFVFNNIGQPSVAWTSADATLANLMSRYWTNFAKTGDPNDSDLPDWPRYTRTDQTTLELNVPPVILEGARREKLDLLEEDE